MTHDDRAHLAAILTRAAILEAARQRDVTAQDVIDAARERCGEPLLERDLVRGRQINQQN